MSELVDTDAIEAIVGTLRYETLHLGRAISAEQTVYILHSHECKASGIDLRDCRFSVALDGGIDGDDWHEYEDRPVALSIDGDGFLVPRDSPADEGSAE